MAIDALVETLRANGRRRAAGVLREARAEVRAIRLRAEREETRRRGEVLARRQGELRAELAGDIARARAEARRDVLEARRALLARVFARAVAALPAAIESSAYVDGLPGRIELAARYVSIADAVLECPPGLAPALRAAAGTTGPSVEPHLDADAGFRLRSADGHVVVDDTLASRLARLRPTLEIELVERLQEGGPGP